MTSKNVLLKECLLTLKKPHVEKWYLANMKGKPQVETIKQLLNGIVEGTLTLKDALQIALIVGYQWNINFKEKETKK